MSFVLVNMTSRHGIHEVDREPCPLVTLIYRWRSVSLIATEPVAPVACVALPARHSAHGPDDECPAWHRGTSHHCKPRRHSASVVPATPPRPSLPPPSCLLVQARLSYP